MPTFFDDPVDVTPTATATATYHDIDLTSHVGSDAGSLAIALFLVEGDSTFRGVEMRGNGQSWDPYSLSNSRSLGRFGYRIYAVKPDGDDIVEIAWTNKPVLVNFLGYFTTDEAVGHSEPVSRAPSTNSTYSTFTVSGSPSDCVGVVLVHFNNTTAQYRTAARAYGDSDDRFLDSQCCSISGVDGSYQYEVKEEVVASQECYEIGYLKSDSGFQWKGDSEESLTVSASEDDMWTNKTPSTLRTGATHVLVACTNSVSSGYDCVARSGDSTWSLQTITYGGPGSGMAKDCYVVKLGSSDDVDVYIDQYNFEAVMILGDFVPPTSTYTGSAALGAGGVTFSGSAGFTAPTYSGSAAIEIGGVTFAGSATSADPTFTATAGLGVGPVEFAGSGTFTEPTYAGEATLSIAGIVFEGTGTTTVPEFAATAALEVAGLLFAGDATFDSGTFTASADLSVGGIAFDGEASFESPTFTASAAVTIGPVEFVGSGTSADPTMTASADVSIGAVEFQGEATFDSGTFTATASLTTGGIEFAGEGTFDAGTFTASASLVAGAVSFDGSALYVEAVTATASLTSGAVVFVGSASYSAGTFTASAELTVGAIEFASAGTFVFLFDPSGLWVSLNAGRYAAGRAPGRVHVSKECGRLAKSNAVGRVSTSRPIGRLYRG